MGGSSCAGLMSWTPSWAIGSEADHRAALLERSAELVEVHGVLVLGHSRLDHAVLGSDEDAAEWDAIWQLLWPGHDLADTSRSNRRRVRDAMHVRTAHRYGFDAFITLDGSGKRSGLLDRSALVKVRLGLWIAHPAEINTLVDRLKARYLERNSQNAGDRSTDE